MPDDRKSNWQESWAQSFEEGFYDNLDGVEDDKKAVLVELDAQGRSKVVGVATGAEAEKVIAEAERKGVQVRRDAAHVESLIGQEESGAPDVPNEIYELMSAVIGFAQDLSQEWVSRSSDSLPRAGALSGEEPQGGRPTSIEYSHEDVQ
jgi:type III secretion system FlhB-like substrate exporter